MQSIVFAAPALPGGVERLEETAAEVLGPRRAELDDFHRRLGISREHWYVQQTPSGPLVLVYLAASDLGHVFQTLAASEAPFDAWFREQAKAVHGIDFAKPMTDPLPEQVLAIDRT